MKTYTTKTALMVILVTIALLNGCTPPPPKATPKECIDKGLKLFKEGKLKEALALFDEGVKGEPNEPSGYFYQGSVRFSMGDYPASLESFNKALKLSPDNPLLYYNIGNSLAKMGKGEEAIAAYDKSLALKPSNAKALYNKGVILEKMGKKDEAMECFAFANRIDPNIRPEPNKPKGGK